MHCYSLPQYVDECNERGYYASFAGNVTYKNAADLRAAAARVRDDRLLVETDAPFLSAGAQPRQQQRARLGRAHGGAGGRGARRDAARARRAHHGQRAPRLRRCRKAD